MRKHFFANEENGYLTAQQGRQQPVRNPITGRMTVQKKDLLN